MTVSTNCRHCTVPVDTGDVCGWCSHYDGPEPDRYAVDSTIPAARELDEGERITHGLASAFNRTRQLSEDLQDIIDTIADDDPIDMSVLGLVSARSHLIAARRLIDRAASDYTGPTVIVTSASSAGTTIIGAEGVTL